MRFFSSEIIQAYDTYSFGYCNYTVREPKDRLSDIYNLGFLPYSGANEIKNVCYMARSVRINLASWELNSENRRVHNRFNNLSGRGKIIPLQDFDYTDENFLQFCLHYFEHRHGPHVMPRDRLLFVLESGFVTHIIEYAPEGQPMAYVFLGQDEYIRHFFYSFYELAHMNQSLGMWLMVDATMQAQEAGKDYMYLGTAYGAKGLYKTNFSNLEFWNGHEWIASREQLRARCKTDSERTHSLMDEWKSSFSDSLFATLSQSTVIDGQPSNKKNDLTISS